MGEARVLDGKAVAAALRAKVATDAAALATRLGRPPGLAVVLVGDDPASQVYVRGKVKACGEAGLRSELLTLPAATSREQLLAELARLNADAAIDGILVQLPLPAHIPEAEILEAIDPAKDVDGFHPANAGRLLLGRPGLVPCTPAGVMALLDAYQVPLAGQHAVVIGRSHIVGKPMALLLLARHATVTICHSRTPDLGAVVRQADVVVAAVGKAGLVTGAMLKPGAVVVDVGINRGADGKLAGDVDGASARAVAGFLSPVPGGVGPMTIAQLLANTVQAAAARARA